MIKAIAELYEEEMRRQVIWSDFLIASPRTQAKALRPKLNCAADIAGDSACFGQSKCGVCRPFHTVLRAKTGLIKELHAISGGKGEHDQSERSHAPCVI